MFYEEQVRDGVLCCRSTPVGDWVPMSAERLTAMLLELRQRQVASPPVFVPQPYPVLAPQPTWVPAAPWQPPYTITCGGAR